jgi:hypothetical protein
MKRRRKRRLALPGTATADVGVRGVTRSPPAQGGGARARRALTSISTAPALPVTAGSRRQAPRARTWMRLAAIPASCSHSPSARPRRPLTSAVVFGAAYATIVAIAVIWSTNVFAEQPSASLAAVTVMSALGPIIGPPTLGAVADHTGPSTALATRTLPLTRHDHAGTTRTAADQRQHRPEARAMNPSHRASHHSTAAPPTWMPQPHERSPHTRSRRSVAARRKSPVLVLDEGSSLLLRYLPPTRSSYRVISIARAFPPSHPTTNNDSRRSLAPA